MTKKERVRQILYDTLVLLGVLALLTYICRLWPILLLVLLGILIAMTRLLFLSSKQVKVIKEEPITEAPKSDVTEQDVRTLAYAVILRRITELVTQKYPYARWVWESPCAMQQIELGGTVYILVNRAGGYKRAKVTIQNLQVIGFEFEQLMLPGSCRNSRKEKTVAYESDLEKEHVLRQDVQVNDPYEDQSVSKPDVVETAKPEKDAVPEENYELLAFEWVESHIIGLNEQCNEAIGKGQTDFLITAEQLPVPESWENIRNELLRTGLEEVICSEDGITINLLQ